MRVDKRPVETIKDGNEDGGRTDRNKIGKIGGNGHDTLLSMGCVSTRAAPSVTSPRRARRSAPCSKAAYGLGATDNIISKMPSEGPLPNKARWKVASGQPS